MTHDHVATSAAPMHEQELPPPSTGAGFWLRAGARILDICLLTGFAFFSGVLGAVVLAIMSVVGVVDGNWLARIEANNGGVSTFVFGAVASVTYHGLCEALAGATLGKLAFGLRVVDETGGRASMGAAFIRSLASYVDLLFFGLVGWSSMKESALQQRYGDRWAKTLVVSKHEAGIRARRTTGAVVLALTAALVATCAVQAAGVVMLAL